MSVAYTNNGPIFLTTAQYEALRTAGTLVAGQEYRITDWVAVGTTAPSGTSPITTIWKGTQAQYDALGTYSDTTEYIIISST